MAIIDDFPEFLKAAAISRNTITNVDGVRTAARVSIATVECLFWEGSAAESQVSERFRDRTAAAIAMYPGVDIRENDIVTIDGVEYHALSPDNIGKAQEVIIVALEIFA